MGFVTYSANESTEPKDDASAALGNGIFFTIIAIVSAVAVWFCRDKIYFAITLIKEGSQSVEYFQIWEHLNIRVNLELFLELLHRPTRLYFSRSFRWLSKSASLQYSQVLQWKYNFSARVMTLVFKLLCMYVTIEIPKVNSNFGMLINGRYKIEKLG